LNRDGPRFSSDIDISTIGRVGGAPAARRCGGAVKHGSLCSGRREPGIHCYVIGTVRQRGSEWAARSDFRFFPAVADELFGYD